MPSTLPITEDDLFNACHARIITDSEPDPKYNRPISNLNKVIYLCQHLELNLEDFYLCDDYPLMAWAASDDQELWRCGLYITDLRKDFFALLVQDDEASAPHKVWESHAEAEFMMDRFNALIFIVQSGEVLEDHRVIH